MEYPGNDTTKLRVVLVYHDFFRYVDMKVLKTKKHIPIVLDSKTKSMHFQLQPFFKKSQLEMSQIMRKHIFINAKQRPGTAVQ